MTLGYSLRTLIVRVEKHLRIHGLELTPSARAMLVQAFEKLQRASTSQRTLANFVRNFHVCEEELVRVATIERRHRDRRALEHFTLGDSQIRYFLARCPYLSTLAV
jgi:hypothetical protein